MDGELYTRDGKPCRVRGDKVFDRSGAQVGRLRDGRVFGPDGAYAATVVGDRLVYRATDVTGFSLPFIPERAMPMTSMPRLRSTILGQEPFTEDRS